MFNLLVDYNGWKPASDELTAGRVFEYTDEGLVAWFKPNGTLDESKLLQYPALMLSETGGRGPQIARICTLRSVRMVPAGVRIEYTPIDGLPAISNAMVSRLAPALDISPAEFSRTHWAIKNVDLFQVLLQQQVSSALSPKLFRLSGSADEQADLVSVMMPFDKAYDDVFEAIKSAAVSQRMRCLRADNFWRDDAIIQDVVTLLCTSRIVICDCTGKNPNVFYEIGIAHTLGRNAILITQAANDIPFDLRHVRYVSYLDNIQGRTELSAQLVTRIRTLCTIP